MSEAVDVEVDATKVLWPNESSWKYHFRSTIGIHLGFEDTDNSIKTTLLQHAVDGRNPVPVSR